MSTSTNHDDDEKEGGNEVIAGDSGEAEAFAGRHLRSFPRPELEVVVGENQKIYRYHTK